MLKCLQLWSNTDGCWEAGCRLDCWLNPIKNDTSVTDTYWNVQIVAFGLTHDIYKLQFYMGVHLLHPPQRPGSTIPHSHLLCNHQYCIKLCLKITITNKSLVKWSFYLITLICVQVFFRNTLSCLQSFCTIK